LIASASAYFLFDVVALRVDIWWNPWPTADTTAYQIVQSLMSIAAGGVFGQGIGQGYPTIVPVAHSDFVFAAIGEEWGLLGVLAVLAALAVLVVRGLRIAVRAHQPFRPAGGGLNLMLGVAKPDDHGGALNCPTDRRHAAIRSYAAARCSNFVIVGCVVLSAKNG
jgi:cell division protein FtsW (lipid II flippase)